MRILLTLLALIATTATAHAQARTLTGRGKDVVFVWKGEKARSEGSKLIVAGATDPKLYEPLVACVVPSGSEVVVTDGGVFSSDVTVIKGKHTGCRGNVSNSYLVNDVSDEK